MTSTLRRHLGLYSVFTISVGAMIGSGIFVLPGLAFIESGPGLILAFLLAGFIVLPAALSQSEMATAIPKAGGAYLYIDRALGPLVGTVAGFGVWFSLVFKAAFALDGLGAYLDVFTTFPPKILALVLGAALVGINLGGVRESGRFQSLLVTGVFVVLLLFIGGGATLVESERYHPFLPHGFGSLLTTAGIVFVSYAGVTKVASVAEEVDRPTRNLPVGIISSVLVMMFLYPALVYVMVGVTPSAELEGSLVPMALAAEHFAGQAGRIGLAVTAVVALVSMANAGLLASSRYPLAMARRRLAPEWLARISDRTDVPVGGIVVTGVLLLLLVAFVPIIDLAKLASAFQLLIFSLINIALIIFRRADLWWYRPRFRSPGYPWVQVAGIVAALVLLTEMGMLSVVGGLAMVAIGTIWYQVYGRSRALRESAVKEAVRQRVNTRLVEQIRDSVDTAGKTVFVVPATAGDDPDLLRLAGYLAPDGQVRTVPPETTRIPGPRGATAVVTNLHPGGGYPDIEVDGGPRPDLVMLTPGRPLSRLETVTVLGSGGPYDAAKISLAIRMARGEDARIRFVHVLDTAASKASVRAIERYHAALSELTEVPTESVVEQADDLLGTLTRLAAESDVVLVGASTERRFLSGLTDRIVRRIHQPVIVIRPGTSPAVGILPRLLDRLGG